MSKSVFKDLLESVRQMDAVRRGARRPARTHKASPAVEVKSIRAKARPR